MGVKVIKREYKNQFFDPSQSTDWLLGNVGDWQSLEVTFEAIVDFLASQQDSVTVDSTNNIFKLNNGKSWSDYGFDIGDEVQFTYTFLSDSNNDGVFSETAYVFDFTITNLYADTLETDWDFDLGPYEIIPTDRGNVKIRDVKFTSNKEPEGLKLRYSHLSNEDYQNDNLRSFLDGTTTEFSYAGLNSLPIGVNALMNPDGLQSGMAIDKVFIQKISASENNLLESFFVGGGAGATLSVRKVVFPFTGQTFVNRPTQTYVFPLFKQINTDAGFQNNVGGYVPINQNTTSFQSYLNGVSTQCFYYNIPTGGVKYFDAQIKMFISAENENSGSDYLSLVVIRYTNGGSLNYAQIIELKRFNNVSSLIGQTLEYNDTFGVFVNQGDSLVLAVEWNHNAQETTRFCAVGISQCNLKALNQSSAVSRTYKATINFMMPTLFENIDTLPTLTPPSILFNDGSLTDNFELEVFPEWNNPNTSIINNLDHTERLGNTGWFNENFNGLDNNFKIESIKYFDDLGNALSSLDYTGATNVEIVASGFGPLSSNMEFGFGFSWIPQNEDDYKQNERPYHKNLYINTGRKYNGGFNDSFNLNETSGAFVFEGDTPNQGRMDVVATESIIFNDFDGDKVKMTAKFIPTPEFASEFESKGENDRNYCLWISVADVGVQINFSNRVSLLADYKPLIKNIPPAGPYPSMKNAFIEHPQDENVVGESQYYGFIEDDVLSRLTFNIDPLQNINLRSMTFGYEVLNTETGLAYELERYNVNLTNIPIGSDGVQDLNIDEIRGFKLEDGNNKNWVKINRDEVNDLNGLKAYKAFFATKIRWEDWILRSGVPTDYFDNNNLNDGYNNDWLDYLRTGNLGDHIINFYVLTEVVENDELKVYKNQYEITFNDYDENLNIETTHEYFRDSDNQLLNVGLDPETQKPLGVLLDNEPTRIEITYTNITSDFDISKMYAVTTIEIDKGAGEFEHRQLSSVWGFENDNILVPLPSETNLKFEQTASNVVKASCLVDNTRLENALRYKITGRIGCFPEGNGNTQNPNGKYEAKYEAKYE